MELPYRQSYATHRSLILSRLPKVPKTPAPPPSTSTIIKIVALSCTSTLTVIVAAIGVALWLRQRSALAEMLEEWELDHPHRFPYNNDTKNSTR